MFLFNRAKVIGLFFVSLLVLTVIYGFFLINIEDSILNRPLSNVKEFFRGKPLDLPEIRLTKIDNVDNTISFSKNLFGTLPSAEKVLVETKLNLSLKGTLPSSDQDQGIAIITVGTNNEKLIHIGDEILPGVVLLQVFEDQVILDRSNAREILRFLSDNTNPPFLLNSRSAVSESPSETVNPKEGQKSDVITKLLIRQYEQRFKESPSSVLDSIGLKESENQYQVSQDSILLQVGFQSGDKIISINGQPIKALLANSQAIASVISMGSVKIMILRGQQPLFIKYQFK